MEFQKYFVGFAILAFGVLCLLAGRFEHLRRRTFTPTKGICEAVNEGRKIFLPVYQHTFRYKYNGLEKVGKTVRDYERLDLNTKHKLLVNPMKPEEVLQAKDIDRITRNEKFGWIFISIGFIAILAAICL